MALADNWKYRCRLAVVAAMVVGGLHASVALILNQDNLPSEIFDADGSFPAKNGGGDIRFSTDVGGVNEIPFEIVNFVTNDDPALGVAEICLTLPVLSNTSDFYIWWDNVGAVLPAYTDSNGRNAVHSLSEFSSHHNEIDSTGKHTIIKWGSQSGDSFDGVDDLAAIDRTSSRHGDPIDSLTKPYSISCVIKPLGHGASFGHIFSPRRSGGSATATNELSVFIQLHGGQTKITSQPFYGNGGVKSRSGVIAYGTTYHVYADIAADGQTRIYLDGVEQTGPYFDFWTCAAGIGGGYEGSTGGSSKGSFQGDIYYVRARNGVYSVGRILTESNNQKNPAGFITAGAVETITSGFTASSSFGFEASKSVQQQSPVFIEKSISALYQIAIALEKSADIEAGNLVAVEGGLDHKTSSLLSLDNSQSEIFSDIFNAETSEAIKAENAFDVDFSGKLILSFSAVAAIEISGALETQAEMNIDAGLNVKSAQSVSIEIDAKLRFSQTLSTEHSTAHKSSDQLSFENFKLIVVSNNFSISNAERFLKTANLHTEYFAFVKASELLSIFHDGKSGFMTGNQKIFRQKSGKNSKPIGNGRFAIFPNRRT
jgi:hypothetical protein